ncbi:MAG: hypothetical protein ACUVWP_09705 [bacterium]
MDRDKIIEILMSVRDRKLSVEEALENICSVLESEKSANKVRVRIYNLERKTELVKVNIPIKWVKWLVSAIPHNEGLIFNGVKISMDEFISKLDDIKEGEIIEVEVPEKKIKIEFSLG